tara:strand:+ start:752 stop:1402 length:651 start_codon:yes stop_codon:yes gene_type:complete
MKQFNHVGNSLQDLQTENINGKRHYVTPQGNKYLSITSLLSNLSAKGISEWRKRVGEAEANKITRQASGRGTRLHTLCEQYIENKESFLEDALPDVVDMFYSINPFLDRIDNVHVVEGALYSDELGVAGRTDLIAEFDGYLSVIDYKSSRKVKNWEMCHAYFMQGAFYAYAYEELTGTPLNNIVIIMAVENDKPLLFRETRNRWLNPLKQVITKYS